MATLDFEEILLALPAAALILDCEGKIVFLNAKAGELMGWKRASLIGRSFASLVVHKCEESARNSLSFSNDFPVPSPTQVSASLWIREECGSETALGYLVSLFPHKGSDFYLLHLQRREEDLSPSCMAMQLKLQITEQILSTGSSHTAWGQVVELLGEALAVPYITVELYDQRQGGKLFFVAWSARRPLEETVAVCKAEESLSGMVVKTRQPLCYNFPDLDPELHSEDHQDPLRRQGFKSVIRLPMRANRRVLGVLTFAFEEKLDFDDTFIGWLESLANYCIGMMQRCHASMWELRWLNLRPFPTLPL